MKPRAMSPAICSLHQSNFAGLWSTCLIATCTACCVLHILCIDSSLQRYHNFHRHARWDLHHTIPHQRQHISPLSVCRLHGRGSAWRCRLHWAAPRNPNAATAARASCRSCTPDPPGTQTASAGHHGRQRCRLACAGTRVILQRTQSETSRSMRVQPAAVAGQSWAHTAQMLALPLPEAVMALRMNAD